MLIENLKSYPAHFIRRVHQISTALFSNHCSDYEITSVQYAALLAIQSYPDRDQSTLAGLIGYDRATMGKVLEMLEKKGWINRYRNPCNQRTKLVSMTEQGFVLIETIQPLVHKLNKELVSPLNKEEQQEFMRLLEIVVEAHNEYSRAPVRTARKPASANSG